MAIDAPSSDRESADGDSADGPAETTFRVLGRLVTASNATFLCAVGPDEVHWVHKPVAGERPLWDYPDGNLAQREVAAFRLSEAAGFDVVPETLLVEGPWGPGSLQRWIDSDPEAVEGLVDLVPADAAPDGWFPIMEGLDENEREVVVVHADDTRLRRMALFDAVINNSDRKGGHVLVDGDRVWGCDHGVSLGVEPKLRTLLWGWAGEPLTADERGLLERTIETADAALEGLVTAAEIDALHERCAAMLAGGTLPEPNDDWPSVPWPPF
ncbi:SCO1664 family protein [Mariniluteicoccus flavus]